VLLMPRIPKPVLECVVYLYPSRGDAEHGDQAGGSGFVVGVDGGRNGWDGWVSPWSMPFWDDGMSGQADENFLYAVTAAHVIYPGKSPVIRLTTERHGTQVLDEPPSAWIRHPDGDDVAICPIGVSAQHLGVPFIPESVFVTKRAVESGGVGVGDDAFFVGRFVSHEGRQRNAPSARFGNISMLPEDPVRHPGFQIDQESFLVEMRSLSGYSGSPVFVYSSSISLRETIKGSEARREAKRSVQPRGYREPKLDEQVEARYQALSDVHFLGVDWAHLKGQQAVLDGSGDPVADGWYVEDNSGMMAVVPAWKVSELLHDEDLAATRADSVERWKQVNSPT
jgi:hypothetical protein